MNKSPLPRLVEVKPVFWSLDRAAVRRNRAIKEHTRSHGEGSYVYRVLKWFDANFPPRFKEDEKPRAQG